MIDVSPQRPEAALRRSHVAHVQVVDDAANVHAESSRIFETKTHEYMQIEQSMWVNMQIVGSLGRPEVRVVEHERDLRHARRRLAQGRLDSGKFFFCF